MTWCYDRIGHRFTESRDGATPDAYQYLVNATTGNTPILDQVLLGVGGARDYTWGAAGHLEEVAAGANVLDFSADPEGRLSGVTRTAAGETVALGYDGRSFLLRAEETAGGTSSVEPIYDSAGLVHVLRRKASPIDPEELAVFFYLAGRPVAQVAIDGAAIETWTYISTDPFGLAHRTITTPPYLPTVQGVEETVQEVRARWLEAQVAGLGSGPNGPALSCSDHCTLTPLVTSPPGNCCPRGAYYQPPEITPPVSRPDIGNGVQARGKLP